MKNIFKKIILLFLFKVILMIGLFAQDSKIKDSLTIDETWKLLSTIEKLTFDEGMDIIYRIKHDQNDSIPYKLVTDSIFNIIYRPFYLSEIRNQQIIDSMKKVVRDTLKFSLEINQETITDYKNIHFFISYLKDQKRKVLKLQTHDSLIILPPYDQVFDSVYIILQYKDIYLVDEIYIFKQLYHIMGFEYYHETYPYTKLSNDSEVSPTRERARKNKSEGFLYIHNIVYGDGTCMELLIPDVKKYYKYGKQFVRNK